VFDKIASDAADIDVTVSFSAHPIVSGLLIIAHIEKCVCSSEVVNTLFPTSSISRSSQWPAPANCVWGTAWLRIRGMVFQEGIMSLVMRYVFPRAGAHKEGYDIAELAAGLFIFFRSKIVKR